MTPVVLLAVLSGALAFLSFPTYSFWPLIFVALVPLLLAVRGVGVVRAAGLGWLAGVVTHWGWLPWALPTIARFQHISTAHATPFFIPFILYQALQFGLFAGGVAWIGRAEAAQMSIVSSAAWWTLLEWGFPKIIPWSFGNALAASPLLRQTADVGGVFGLSFLIALVNVCIADAVTAWSKPSGRWPRSLATAATVVVVMAAYGTLRRNDAVLATKSPGVTVAIVQGGVLSGRDDLVSGNEEAWNTYAQLTYAAVEEEVSRSDLSDTSTTHELDLFVWPETALRVYLRQDDAYRQHLLDLTQRLDRAILVGSLDVPHDGQGELNAAYLVQPAGRLHEVATERPTPPPLQIYHKTILLPFGEYAPGSDWLPFLRHWQTTGRFVPGEPAHILTLLTSEKEAESEHEPRARLTSLAPSICFEAIWSGVFNQMVRDGAEFLINLTDDGWFGDTAGPYQHLQAATLRAVETRRWLVRASNSGVSAFVDPSGRIVASLPLGAVGVLRHRLETSQRLTFYVRWGNWPILLCATIVSVALWRRALMSRSV